MRIKQVSANSGSHEVAVAWFLGLSLLGIPCGLRRARPSITDLPTPRLAVRTFARPSLSKGRAHILYVYRKSTVLARSDTGLRLGVIRNQHEGSGP